MMNHDFFTNDTCNDNRMFISNFFMVRAFFIPFSIREGVQPTEPSSHRVYVNVFVWLGAKSSKKA